MDEHKPLDLFGLHQDDASFKEAEKTLNSEDDNSFVSRFFKNQDIDETDQTDFNSESSFDSPCKASDASNNEESSPEKTTKETKAESSEPFKEIYSQDSKVQYDVLNKNLNFYDGEKNTEASPAEQDEEKHKFDSNESECVQIDSKKLDEIIESQQMLAKQLEDLNNMFDNKIMRTEYDEKIVDKMHSELQKYKADMYSKIIKPILKEIIQVRDSVIRMSAFYLQKPEGEQDIPNKVFKDYAFDLQDILEHYSVEIYRSDTNDPFDPAKQNIVKKIATDDKLLHGKVAESYCCGYIYNGKVLSAEKIAVFYFEENIQKNNDSEVIDNG